jgi:hypothetical protein
VEGCPEITARRHLIQAAIHFCRITQAWMEVLDPAPIADKVATYELDLPTGTRLVMVREVWGPHYALTPKSLPEVVRIIPAWQTQEGEPQFYNMLTWNELRIYPIPVNPPDGFALTVRAAVAPADTATDIPAAIAQRYRDAILARAKMTLMSMPNKAWTNVDQATINAVIYQSECDQASIARLTDGVASGGTAYPVRFGA